MMLKYYRIALILGLVLLIISGTLGCGAKTPEDIFIAAQKALNDIKSYSTVITYIVVDGEEQREYRFKQWVSTPASFKIQMLAPENLVGKCIVSDGNEVLIEHSKVGDSLIFKAESLEQQRPLFIGDFLNSFWLSEDVEKKIHVDDEGTEYVVLTCPSSETGTSKGRQELWLRWPKLVPTKMVNYGGKNDISELILFEEFDKNWKPEENFFSISD